MIRRVLQILAVAAIGACSSVAQQTDAAAPQRAEARPPNVIIIFADDLGWGDISLNGADLIRTPNIDRIGQEGIQLDTFYAAANVCTPSRAALLTGRYPIRSGMQHVIFPQSTDGLPVSEVTIAEMLKARGYATHMIGKWHLGHSDAYWPTNHGFDSFYGVPYSNDMQPFDLYRDKTVVQSPADLNELTRNYFGDAEAYIRAHAGEPFFLYVAETAPHQPLNVPEEAAGQSPAGLYGDVVEEMDRGVGQILQALDDEGLAENTLVIFTSDNGPWFEGGAGRFRGRKGGTHEGSYRVPMLARLPGVIPAGTRRDAMAMTIDLLPTIAAMTDADVPEDRTIDGRDISALLEGGTASAHDVLYFFNGNEVVGARDDRFKLVLHQYYRDVYVPFEQFGGLMLFDLATDPAERFSFVREQPEAVERLKQAVSRMRDEIEPLKKAALNPFASVAEDTPIGPDLEPGQ